MNNTLVNEITKLVLENLRERQDYVIPVGVSTRHVHLSPDLCEKLFGANYQLSPMKKLQAGEFAAKETVTILGPKMRALCGVRLLGPFRKQTQAEISRTDAIYLGIDAPWRSSGDLAGSAAILLVGPKGSVALSQGAIIAKRHIHVPTLIARDWKLKDRQEVAVEALSERAVIFKGVEIRVADHVDLQLHVDTDDANAAGLSSASKVKILTGGAICG